MKLSFVVRAVAIAAAALASYAAGRPAVAAAPILLQVDTSKAPTQNLVFTRETIPVSPGRVTLYYPKWIPGQHEAAGPIANFAGLEIEANGAAVPWHRQAHDMFAFDVDVPAGVTSIDVNATYLGATFGNYSNARVATPNMLCITWHQNLLYPATGTIQNTIFKPSIVLPGADWQFATALTGAQRAGNTVTFDDVSLEHLVDSPLDAGTNYKRWVLWQDGDAGAYLNVFADVPS